MMRGRLWKPPRNSCVLLSEDRPAPLRCHIHYRPYSKGQPPPSFRIAPPARSSAQSLDSTPDGQRASSSWAQPGFGIPSRDYAPRSSVPPSSHERIQGSQHPARSNTFVSAPGKIGRPGQDRTTRVQPAARHLPDILGLGVSTGRLNPSAASFSKSSHTDSPSLRRHGPFRPHSSDPTRLRQADAQPLGRRSSLVNRPLDGQSAFDIHGKRGKDLGSNELQHNGPDSREWAQLARRGSVRPHREGRPSNRRLGQPGLLDQLANNIIEPRGPQKLAPSTGNEEFWSNVKDRLPNLDATSPKPPRSSDFMSHFKSRVPESSTEQRGQAKASDNWKWVEDEKRTRVNAISEVARSSWAGAPPVAHHTEIDGGRGRKTRPERPKSKPRPRRRSYDEMEDDNFRGKLAAGREEEWRRRKEARRKEKAAVAKSSPTPILLPELISVHSLGSALGVKLDLFLAQMAELGFEDINDSTIMSGETAALVAQEYGFEPTVETGESVDLKPRPPPKDPSTLPLRPPIVTIMGHVDHGKTTMLDWLRKSSVAAQEHGGITQHIGAFSVKLSAGKIITFLDTPGHAAFLTMRQRGANVTDMVVLVVAADDSVKPQTLEALRHARAAKVPIIVAINKIDKDEARVDQVKADLARHGVEIEDFGGDVQVVCVSGKTGQGMDSLEENILTLAEIMDVRTETDGMAEGWVLESSVKPLGRVATVLIKRGTLRKGDIVVAGTSWARIRVLKNEAGMEIAEAPPGSAVEILGWKDAPAAGDQVLQASDEGVAKVAAQYREELKEREKAAFDMVLQGKRAREKAELAATQHDAGAEKVLAAEEDNEAGTHTTNFTVKGDVMGSVEAVCAAVMEIGNNEVRPQILRSAPGQITEFDVEHAAASDSCIINFNNPIPGMIRRKAEDAGVPILDHSIIYHLTDAVKDKLSSKLAPTVSTRVVGEAEVLQVFPINVQGRVFKNIAGCRVRNGQVTKSALYRVVRNGEKIFEGKLGSLKQGKKDVSEMRKGTECGIAFEDWQDFQEGDQIQAYEEIREQRHL